jgi:putative CocE/NonD family hydrolase
MRMRSPLTLLLIALLLSGAIVVAVALLPAWRRAVLGALPARLYVAIDAMRGGFEVDHSLRISMPDGVGLAGSLYLPNDRTSPLATVLVRSPYGRLDYAESYWAGIFFARHGYAVLVQDLRGTGDSGGELIPWRDADSDGVATLDWIRSQPWSNGKVGTFGCSALGETQLVLARRNHPAHAAMIPSGAGGAIGDLGGSHGYFGLYEGGVFELASGFGWFSVHGAKSPDAPPPGKFDTAATLAKLPVADLVRSVRGAPTGYDDFLATPPGDAAWRDWGYLDDDDRIQVPAFLINTWNDQTVADSLLIAEHIRSHDPQAARHLRVLIAPGRHCAHDRAVDDDGEAMPLDDWYLAWFDYWLRGKGDGLASLPMYQYFMVGENRWHAAQRWPPENSTPARWYLRSGGKANSREGDGVLSLSPAAEQVSDSFVYDPLHPVPSRGGPICCTGNPQEPVGAVDQADVEKRDDVLVYTSAPLNQQLRIAGTVRATLSVSSDAPDTDLVARLVDVAPDGRALNIQEGALRLRYRDGLPAKLMEPGERYTVTVSLRSIAYRIAPGHRLRLDVTSSSFPRLERNLNTGADVHTETQARKAGNRLHHGPAGESFVEFDVLPEGA